jgi:hypothetical protein
MADTDYPARINQSFAAVGRISDQVERTVPAGDQGLL